MNIFDTSFFLLLIKVLRPQKLLISIQMNLYLRGFDDLVDVGKKSWTTMENASLIY